MTLTDHQLSEAKEAIMTLIDNEWNDGAVGTDGTEPDSTDTSLGNQVLQKAREDMTREGDTWTWSLFIASTEANENVLEEVGVFDTDDNMKVREVFDSIDKSSEFEIWFDVHVTVSTEEVSV